MEVAGSLRAAEEAELFALERARQTGMRMSELYCTAMLACTHLDFGDVAAARTWDQRADEIANAVGALDRALVHLSNKIEFAILASDGASARKWLELAAGGYPELQSPLKVCMTRGYDLLIRQAWKASLPWTPRRSMNSWTFTCGHAHQHLPRRIYRGGSCVSYAVRDGAQQPGKLLTAYLTVHRRERFPVRRGLSEGGQWPAIGRNFFGEDSPKPIGAVRRTPYR